MLKNFFKSLDTLNIQQPDIFTKTTDHVKDMAYILKKLMDNGTFVQYVCVFAAHSKKILTLSELFTILKFIQ